MEENFTHYLCVCRYLGSLELQTSQLNIMNGWLGAFFVYMCSPHSIPWWLVKLEACLPGLLFQLTLQFFNFLSSTPPLTCSMGYFPFFSFISTSWRCLSSLKYHIVIVDIRLYFGGFLLPNWGGLLQVSIWLEKNCVSICFQSQHLCLKSWKCSKKSFCLVILLSFMNGFLEHFLILLHGEWLGLG